MTRFTKPRQRRPEEEQQTLFFDYCRAKSHAHPAYAMAFAIPNERKASIQRRIAMKRAGLTKGIPDICVPVANDKYNALFIEMKVKPNKPSPEQKEIMKALCSVGNYAVLCWSADEAIEILDKYIADKL